MNRFRIFKEYEDGFVLVAVRWFLTTGINADGEFNPEHSPLPDLDRVINRLREGGLTLANAFLLKHFRRVHEREFSLNRVYARSSNSLGFCWISGDETEFHVHRDFNCAHEKNLLWRLKRDFITATPTGYAGELCFLAVREGEESLLYRRKA